MTELGLLAEFKVLVALVLILVVLVVLLKGRGRAKGRPDGCCCPAGRAGMGLGREL